MKKIIIFIFIILTVITSCKFSRQEEFSPQQYDSGTNQDEGITIFFTGNVMGALKPCGCSGGQLGGLDRHTAIFNQASKNQRMIIDTGLLVKIDG